MATRSTIAIENADGTVHQIYCHWDGYLSHNGKILFKNYQDRAKVEELIALGDLSVLDEEIGEKQDFDNRDREKKWTLAYGRDRGETGIEPKVFKDFEDYEQHHAYEEFEFIFTKDDVWSVFYSKETAEDSDEYVEDWYDLELELQADKATENA